MSNWLGLREDQRVGQGLVVEIGRWLAFDTGSESIRDRPLQTAHLHRLKILSRMNSRPQEITLNAESPMQTAASPASKAAD